MNVDTKLPRPKHLLLGSGSSTRIVFMAGLAETLHARNEYDAYVGTSGTSIIYPLIAAGKIGEIKSVLENSRLDTVYFDRKVFKFKDGDSKFNWWNAVFSVITGSPSLTTTKKFAQLMSDLFTPSDFKNVTDSGIGIYLGCANYNTKRALYVNNFKYDYDDFIRGIIASSNMPLFTEPIKLRNSWLTDGGLLDYFGGSFAAWLKPESIDAMLSRPKINLDYFGTDTGYDYDTGWKEVKVNNMIQVGGSLADTVIFNTRIEDEQMLKALKDESEIKSLEMYYPPYLLSEEFYDELTPELVQEWWELGNKVGNRSVLKEGKAYAKLK